MTFLSRRQQIGLFFDFFHLVTPYSSLQISLSSLHIFVYHCTFCALLHVKTCPASASWRSRSCARGQRKCSKRFFGEGYRNGPTHGRSYAQSKCSKGPCLLLSLAG